MDLSIAQEMLSRSIKCCWELLGVTYLKVTPGVDRTQHYYIWLFFLNKDRLDNNEFLIKPSRLLRPMVHISEFGTIEFRLLLSSFILFNWEYDIIIVKSRRKTHEHICAYALTIFTLHATFATRLLSPKKLLNLI